MEKYTVAHYESFSIFTFENGDVINIYNEPGRCYMYNDDTDEHRYIPLTEALQRITNAERIN